MQNRGDEGTGLLTQITACNITPNRGDFHAKNSKKKSAIGIYHVMWRKL